MNKDEAKSEENVEEEKSGESGTTKVVVPNVTTSWKGITGTTNEQAVTEEDLEEKASEVFKPKQDYSVMEDLLEFLEVPAEKDGENKIESILCGYFNKVITALL